MIISTSDTKTYVTSIDINDHDDPYKIKQGHNVSGKYD
jgi:hypothetical protein